MKKKKFFLFVILFLFTGCSADYTIEVFDNEIKEEFSVMETDISKIEEKDDLNMSFKDYAREYGLTNDYYTSYYNMYADDSSNCEITSYNDCKTYDKEYINNSSKVGFKLSSNFNFDEYIDATIPNELMPGFSSSFDGKYLTISGGSNWDFLKGYPLLDKLNITIKSNYSVTSTNANYDKAGEYSWSVTSNNSNNLKPFYIVFDTTSTIKIKSGSSSTVAIIMISIILIVLTYFGIKMFKMKKNNDSI